MSGDKYKVNVILYFILNLHAVWKTLWILISWLLKKPADLDLHCFQLSLYLFFKKVYIGISTVRPKLSCLCIICPLGQVKFSLDKCIIYFYLSLDKFKILSTSTPLIKEKHLTLFPLFTTIVICSFFCLSIFVAYRLYEPWSDCSLRRLGAVWSGDIVFSSAIKLIWSAFEYICSRRISTWTSQGKKKLAE